MAVLKCKMCGGDLNVTADEKIIECEYCGSKQTVPDGSDEKKTNLFNRANRLRMDNEFDKAAGVYESIVSEFPEEAEGYWGLVLCSYGIEYVDDAATGKKIPTCHRTLTSSVMDDDNFNQACENADTLAKSIYREEAKAIDKLQKEIMAVVENEEPYDVFICYKETDDITKARTEDSLIAQDIYTELIKEGYKVFFSRVTLRDKAGSQYEPYIYAALSSAKVMLAIGTKFEYYDAVWVKNEWSRYIAMMGADNTKHLIPCFKNLDAYDIPKEFKNLQALDMGEVTFFKSLGENVERFIPKENNVIETVVVSNVDTNTAPLLKRVFMFLEDGDFERADEYCEKVLDIDPECGDAYLGKLMAELKSKRADDLLKADAKDIVDNANYKKCLHYGASKMKNEVHERIANAAFYDDWWIENGTLKGYRKNKEELTSVTIPNGITEIDSFAFANCTVLESVTLPGSVTSIGLGAFDNCKSLKSIVIPEGITTIYRKAFSGCENLASVTILGNVTSISTGAFGNCTSLKSIVISEGVTTIGAWHFSECENLASITIPSTVTAIDGRVFSGCSALTDINISNNNRNYYFKNGCLIDSQKKELVAICHSSDIPDDGSVTSIGKNAISGNKTIVSVTIPEGVTTIGELAFSGCENLASITIPNSVTSIGESVFSGCNKLTDISISSGNPNYYFQDGCLVDLQCKTLLFCTNGSTISKYSSLTSIGSSAFYKNKTLKSIVIPEGVTSIGEWAFAECENLASITIPNSVTSIGENAFSDCENLASITIPNSVTSIGDGAFSGCKSLKSIVIPEGVTTIGEWAFSDCENLSSITIPCSVTSIGEWAFRNCKSLESIVLPEGVTTIGKWAFSNCENLTSIAIPGSVTSIDDTAFFKCNEKNFTIISAISSYAEQYAKKIGVKFEDPEIIRQRIEEEKRIEEERQKKLQEEAARAREKERLERELKRMEKYRAAGVCQHCGGSFKGLFSKACTKCGKKKDY